MQRRLYQELLWALLGYVIAVLVAAVVAVAPIALKEAVSSPGVAAEQGGIFPYFLDLYIVGAFVVAVFMTFSAWPGFVIALIVGVRRGYRSLKYFSGCGLAAAFVGALIFRGTPPGGWGASTLWSIYSEPVLAGLPADLPTACSQGGTRCSCRHPLAPTFSIEFVDRSLPAGGREPERRMLSGSRPITKPLPFRDLKPRSPEQRLI